MTAFSSHIGADFADDFTARNSWSDEATIRMNRVYRRQRFIYDATRRYCLLGRDGLIANLKPQAGATMLEIGCGTGRNLVHAAGLFPDAQWFGINVSTEMLTSAISAIERRGLAPRIKVAHGDATRFDSHRLFGVAAFDHVMISYSLSMIPDWTTVLQAALGHLKPGGHLHIVDFGRQERLPAVARTLLLRWLELFDVTPRADLAPVLSEMAQRSGATLDIAHPFRGYAQYAVLTLPPEPAKP